MDTTKRERSPLVVGLSVRRGLKETLILAAKLREKEMKREEVEELLVTIYEPDIKSLAQSWLEKDKALSLIFAADKKETDDWVDYGQRVERAILEARQLLEKGEKK